MDPPRSLQPTFTILPHFGIEMAPTLSKTSTLLLIELFKDEPCLWDYNNDNYNKKNKRAAALQRIIEKMEEGGDTLSGILSHFFFAMTFLLCQKKECKQLKQIDLNHISDKCNVINSCTKLIRTLDLAIVM